MLEPTAFKAAHFSSFDRPGNASQQMHFFNVQIDKLPFAQPDVHGLLGQRAVGPLPPMATTNELLAALDGALMSTEQPSPGAGTTIRATVAADGAAAAAPPMLQGEGAIEGSYLSYKVRSPSPPDPSTSPPYAIQCSGRVSRFCSSSPVAASKLSPNPNPAVPGQVRLGPRARLVRLLALQVRRAAGRGRVTDRQTDRQRQTGRETDRQKNE